MRPIAFRAARLKQNVRIHLPVGGPPRYAPGSTAPVERIRMVGAIWPISPPRPLDQDSVARAASCRANPPDVPTQGARFRLAASASSERIVTLLQLFAIGLIAVKTVVVL